LRSRRSALGDEFAQDCLWIKSHWSDELLDSCGVEFARAQQVDVVLRHRAAVFGTDCTGRSLIFP
jgi:hypothetical protein